jgi:single-stranded-DNA-specific exonuclease
MQHEARAVAGVLFGSPEPLPDEIHAVFRLDINEYNAMRSLQLVVEHWEPAHMAASRIEARR